MTWKNLTIGKRIVLGYTILLLLLFVLGIINFIGIGHIVDNAQEVISGNKLNALLTEREVEHLNWAEQVNTLLTDGEVTELQVEMDDHQCDLGKWLYGPPRKQAEQLVPGLVPLIKQLEEPHRHLHESAGRITAVFKQGDPDLPIKIMEIEVAHMHWAARIRDAIIARNAGLEKVQTDPSKCKLGKWLNSDQARRTYEKGDPDFKKIWDTIPDTHNVMHTSAIRIDKALAEGDFELARKIFEQETAPMLNGTVSKLTQLRTEAEHELKGMQEANRIYAAMTLPALHQVQGLLTDIRREARRNILTDQAMLGAAQATRMQVFILGAVTFFIGILIAFFTARGLIRLLTGVVGQLTRSATEVGSASDQIAESSHGLAEGASEQAATLEETSSSLEEMASLTHRNAENTREADHIMHETRDAISQADESMKKLIVSMDEISSASGETQKIVKTIDEISFQTNLLALNAAVEAARAGEAGAGFAVVADEVRNLALRAANSAKDTSNLIDSTVVKVKNGMDLLNETSESFYVASRATARISSLISEITTASGEQAEGIGQVNKAVTEIDKVTQSNAATAEESASAAEELTALAAALRDIVKDLERMVGGKRKQETGDGQARKESSGKKEQAPHPPVSETRSLPPTPNRDRTEKAGAGTKSPEKVIPFDDDEFQDF